jgi:hypothetical protein
MRKIRFLLGAFAMSLAPVAAVAATLTTVPMQGSMIMPMLCYHASDGTLTIQVDPTVPQLIPLLVSNPGDCFDPASPWHDALDPSRQGLAFSRRYGFVMDIASDLLPAGTAIWIRKLSSSDGLGAYRYRSSALGTWEPIFGTAGATNALQWDGTMFHPAFAALPGTNAYTATFEAFLLDIGTGVPVPGANTGPFTFNWTAVPDGRPTLDIARKIVIGWSVSSTNYVVETADTLPSSTWTPVTNTPVLLEGRMAVVLEAGAMSKFYRMRLAP